MFVLVQIVQVVAAPSLGHLTALLGGYLFGTVVGTVGLPGLFVVVVIPGLPDNAVGLLRWLPRR